MIEISTNDGSKLVTKEIQKLLDDAGKKKGTVTIKAGRYLVGSLFIPSGVTFVLDKDAVLLGSQDIRDYPIISTRVAGIDMNWPAAILNVYQAQNVTIEGKGTIDGQGQIFWEKFWGKDSQGGLMKEYANKGLRWAADYDCKRPRNICLYDSENVTVKEITSKQSGFWNTQLSYCKHCVVDGITVINGPGPSTDGIDIDSSHHITVSHCFVECNDDNICVKAGRGLEAFQKQTTCSDILITDCELGKGSGVTIGSETSGGISDITIQNIVFKKTGIGFRIKTANNRGGYIRNIKVSNLEMEDVFHPFNLQTNWYADYSYAKVPETYQETVAEHWKKIMNDVSGKESITEVSKIEIKNVIAKRTYPQLISRAFYIEGNPQRPIQNISFSNVSIEAKEFGKISGVNNLSFESVNVSALEVTENKNDRYER